MSKIYKAFLKHESAVRRVFARYFRSPEDIEDLTQELFVKCFSAEMKAEIYEPKSFLLRAAKNLALSELKKKVRTTTDSIEDSGGSEVYRDEAGVSAELRLDANRKLAALARAIAQLPPDHRRAFWMRRIENLKLAQIAVRLDISVSTVKKHVTEALLLCESSLRAQGYESGEFGADRTSREKKRPAATASVVAMVASAAGASEGGSDG